MPTSLTSLPKAKVQKSQKVVFTQNLFESEPIFEKRLRYLAYSHEVAPTTGKDHWQGFAYSHSPMPKTTWYKIFPGAHVEFMKGDFTSNTVYCNKESTLIEHGKPPRQGERTDIQELKHQLDEGKRPMEIADEIDGLFGTVAHCHRFAESYFQYKRRKRLSHDRTMPKLYIRYGPTGTGKTRWMDETFGLSGWTRVPGKGVRWFDCCDCNVVLFDDVKANEIPPIGQMLELTDRYPIEVENKGGFLTWKPTHIVITSNYPASEWWPGVPKVSYDAFMRRVYSIENMSIPGTTSYEGFDEIDEIDDIDIKDHDIETYGSLCENEQLSPFTETEAHPIS